MKRFYTILVTTLLMVVGFGRIQAQVVDVCAGNDTVELRLGNFQYGLVQWQVSDDNESWMDIDGAIDTVYRFLPDRPRYYRAEVKFPACSEYDYHSQVSYVQIPPKAFAGPDLTLPAGTVARMNATNIDGASGTWEIIQGIGGLLENPTDCRSGFIGEEGEYKLTWTVTNSCGTNTDTVSIKCVRMEYQTDLVIVDETDAILSDSTQCLNGEYIICFNEPVPDVHEGSILLGYMYPSFLRKVVSFEREGNLFTMQTEAGALTDVILAGAINVDPTNDTINGNKPVVKYLDRFPTRKELQEDPFLLRDGSIYAIRKSSKDDPIEDFEFEAEYSTEGYLNVRLLEFDFKKLNNKLDGLKYSSELRVYPNFNANIEFTNGEFKEARMGLYDARLELIQNVRLTKPLTTTLVDKSGYFNKNQIIVGGFLIGLVPTFITLDLPYLFKVQAAIEPPMSFTLTSGIPFTLELYYNDITGQFDTRREKGEPYHSFQSEKPIGTVSAEFNTGLKASVLLADVFGPYFEVNGNFDPSICASAETGDIGGNINMGVDLKLGCRFQLFSHSLTLFDRCLDFRVIDHNESAPKKLFKYGGDNQIYTFGQYLETPISVKVNGWFNTPMPWAYVHFKPENGTVSESVVATDIHGIATTRWKPGIQYGMDRLKVEVYNCQGELAGETPQFFHAYTSATDPCINSNLTVEAYKVNEHTIIPLVNGGKKPYLYSIDGESYSTNAPEIHLQFGHTYCFYVIDANGCEAQAYYNGPSYDCESTSLQLSTRVNGNSVFATAMFGFEPYQFFIDGKDYHDSSSGLSGLNMHTFGDLFDGEYTVRVRDNLGCERSQQITISRTGNLAISLSEIENYTGTACVLSPSSTLIERGICWSSHHAPTVQDFRVSYGTGTGDYTFTITALDPNKTYYVRAYALDASGTSYSREVCINPASNNDLPMVAATGVTNVTPTTAVLSGNVTYEGSSPVTERGVCWGTGNNPTVAGPHRACGSGTGAFSADIYGLTTGLHYYARAYATNSYGTAYGKQVEFDATENGGGGNGVPEGAISGLFSVAPGYQVYFSQGNLQYIGSAATPYWKFADHQWDYFGNNGQAGGSPNVDRDLFGWGTSGWHDTNDPYNMNYQPWSTSTSNVSNAFNYFGYGPSTNMPSNNLTGSSSNYDWGVYNTISNGGNIPNYWRTPTASEWSYVFNSRNTSSGMLYAMAKVNNVNGVILLPDDWNSSYYLLNNANQSDASFSSNIITLTQWNDIEQHGAVFLPTAGVRYESSVEWSGMGGIYWSSSYSDSNGSCVVDFIESEFTTSDVASRCFGISVRLVNSQLPAPPPVYLPQVITTEVPMFTTSTAVCGGVVVSDGGTTVTERGICWSINHNPSLIDNHVSAGLGVGAFTINVTGLIPSTSYYVRAYATNITGTTYGDEVVVTTLPEGGISQEWVDLGLPSGTLWAKCNVGATTPEDYGNYYAWGEVLPKNCYDWNYYTHSNNYLGLIKYCNNPDYGYNNYTDTLTALQPMDDVATTILGNDWRTPTVTEWEELILNTTKTMTIQNGVNGYLFTSSNGNTLFLPAAGNRYAEGLVSEGLAGFYWSNKLYLESPDEAWEFSFGTIANDLNDQDRSRGCSIRPVRSNSNPTGEIPQGAIDGLFSVGEDVGLNGSSIRKVYFSRGNLQYQASTNTWRFAENQWDYVGDDTSGSVYENGIKCNNDFISPTYSGWIDLFGWGTSGYNHGAVCYQPWSQSQNNADYYAYGDAGYDLNDSNGQADWGYNAIVGGGNQTNIWRTLTESEWDYVLNSRTTQSGIRYVFANVNDVNGLILLPDDWDESIYPLVNVNEPANYTNNVITATSWALLESNGAVFLPPNGTRYPTYLEGTGYGHQGQYWSASKSDAQIARVMGFGRFGNPPTHYICNPHSAFFRYDGIGVRLVHDAPNGSGSGNGGGGGHK